MTTKAPEKPKVTKPPKPPKPAPKAKEITLIDVLAGDRVIGKIPLRPREQLPAHAEIVVICYSSWNRIFRVWRTTYCKGDAKTIELIVTIAAFVNAPAELVVALPDPPA